MSKLEAKKELVNNLREKFSKTTLTILTNHTGLTVSEITELRKRLQKPQAEYKIAKNTLIKKAIKDTNLAELEKLLEGPSALLIGYGEPAECAKTFVDFQKEIEKGEVKGGIFEGKLLSIQDIKTFASLPSKPVLLGQIAGLLVANTRDIAGMFEGLIRDVAILIEEVAKKKEVKEVKEGA